MKTLKGMHEKVPNTLTESGGKEPPTLKEIILNSVGAVRGLEPAKKVRLAKISAAVMVMKNEQEFEDGDFELLKEVVDKANIYPDLWVGGVKLKFDEAELDARHPEKRKEESK